MVLMCRASELWVALGRQMGPGHLGRLKSLSALRCGFQHPRTSIAPSLYRSFLLICSGCMHGQRHPLVLQVICRKCSEFKAENSKQSRVCRECFLEEPLVPASPSSETPTELKQNAEVGVPGSWDQDGCRGHLSVVHRSVIRESCLECVHV